MSEQNPNRLKLIALVERLGLLKEPIEGALILGRPDEPLVTLEQLRRCSQAEAIEKIADHLQIQRLYLETVEQTHSADILMLVKSTPADLCWKHKMIPVILENETVLVACANPLDIDGLRTIEFAIGQPVRPAIAEEKKICQLLSRYYATSNSATTGGDIGTVEIINNPDEKDDLTEKSASTPPIVKLVNKILFDAVQLNASDIHIEPTKSGGDVRFRIDGTLRYVLTIPIRLMPYVVSRVKIIANLDIADRRRPQDGRIKIRIGTASRDVRVSTVPTAYGEKAVLRILRSSIEDLNFTELGFPEKIASSMRNLLHRKGRALLVTGPTGSGKTTTLYTALNLVNDGTANIQTVEDPIEFRISGITQIQVNEGANLTFASALRSILRQDPDVILIGEIRDNDTAKIAFQAAQTGHLVLSTLHTNDAPTAIVRLQDLGVDPFVISSCLSGLLAQRLVRKLCPKCSSTLDKTGQERHQEIIKKFNLNPEKLRMAIGCETCSFQGYSGRIGVYSFLEINEEIQHLINTSQPLRQLIRAAKNNGFQTLGASAVSLAETGITTLDEVAAFIDNDELAMAEDTPQVASSKQLTPEASKGHNNEDSVASARKSSAARIARQKVLIVEDDVNVRTVLGLMLEREMFKVSQAANGQEGLELVYDEAPDIVICDLMMPVMDGKGFLARMRANQDTSRIPIIFLTAVADDAHEEDLLTLGATDFISKDASPRVLLARLRKVLGAAQG